MSLIEHNYPIVIFNNSFVGNSGTKGVVYIQATVSNDLRVKSRHINNIWISKSIYQIGQDVFFFNILSVSSEKSGVLITADVDTGDQSKMTIATAEGVGGTVDGSPAETLLYSRGRALLLAQFKSPTRRMLILTGRGGSQMVPSTGSEKVLTDQELNALVSAAEKIKQSFDPEKNSGGDTLPWDIEYGFAKGRLYLFQTRAFAGNSDIRNLPALAALDKGIGEKQGQPFSLEEKIKWRQ